MMLLCAGAKIRQLVGLRAAADTEEEPLWKIRLQLTKPATWVPLIWGCACGAAASGNYRWAFLTPGATLADGAQCRKPSKPSSQQVRRTS